MDYSILVNKENLLSSDYIPENMVEIHEPMGSKIDQTYINRLDKKAYLDFKVMQAAALQAGYEIFIDSSYRSYAYQEEVFRDVVEKKGYEYATTAVAPPGGSEHQTGLAIDIIFRRNNEMIEEQYETDAEIIWLMNNSYKYGFVLRYPKGKEEVTGFKFEPWHYRYVGKELAEELTNNNETLEEYYSKRKVK